MVVAAPDRWDEACFAVPAVRALAASGLGVGVLCGEAQVEFWQTLRGISVMPYGPKDKARKVAADLAGRWQASLAWEADFAAEVFKAAGIVRRLGPAAAKRWLTHPLGCVVEPQDHRVRYYLGAVEELGVTTARAEFFAPAELGIESVPGAVLLCPGSDFGANHEWAVARWLELAKRILAHGRRVTVASVDGGRGLAKTLAEALGAEVEFFHAAPLAGALPVLAVHGLVVAADGSLPHLAAHAGTTCVTLFGPNDPQWKRPLGRRHAFVRRHVECAPCLAPACVMDLRCQNELDLERVWEAVRGKLE